MSNYIDSMTPEEREAQKKIEVVTTYSEDTGELMVINANGITVYQKTDKQTEV